MTFAETFGSFERFNGAVVGTYEVSRGKFVVDSIDRESFVGVLNATDSPCVQQFLGHGALF